MWFICLQAYDKMAADLVKCQEEKNKLLAEAGEEVLMEAVPPVVPGSKFILVNKT